jgi:hypothetical protein
MASKRRTSKIIEKAQVRAASIRSIDPALDLGHGLSLAAFESAITGGQTKLTDYNQALGTADEKSIEFEDAEKQIQDMHQRMLAGVGARFGKNSAEYKQAGGKRPEDRKPRSRKPDTPPVKP